MTHAYAIPESAFISDTGIFSTPMLVRDDPQSRLILEQYFADITDMFRNRFAKFAADEVYSSDDEERLSRLLTEVVKVKKMLGGE